MVQGIFTGNSIAGAPVHNDGTSQMKGRKYNFFGPGIGSNPKGIINEFGLCSSSVHIFKSKVSRLARKHLDLIPCTIRKYYFYS